MSSSSSSRRSRTRAVLPEATPTTTEEEEEEDIAQEDGQTQTQKNLKRERPCFYNGIFPLKLYRLLHEGTYRDIVDFYAPSDDPTFGDETIWNLDQKIWETVDFTKKPRGGIVFHRPRDFFFDLWPLLASEYIKTDPRTCGKAELKKSLNCFVRQMNIYKYVYRTVSIEVNKHIVIGGFDCRFHFCAIKDHPSRQNAFLEANTPVYYFHYCFEPTCSPSKLHNMMLLCKQEKEHFAFDAANEHAKTSFKRTRKMILEELTTANPIKRSKSNKRAKQVQGTKRVKGPPQQQGPQLLLPDDIVHIISASGELNAVGTALRREVSSS